MEKPSEFYSQVLMALEKNFKNKSGAQRQHIKKQISEVKDYIQASGQLEACVAELLKKGKFIDFTA